LIPALVQGDDAPKSLCDAIALAQKTDIDVLIITRGGGSAEDLWAFNDENVAYAVYNCNIPVISAVGHEVDFCICDFVSDLRAPTPSAAAELVAKDISQISEFIDHSQIVLNNFIVSKINADFEALKNQFVQLKSVSPIYKIQNSENILNNLVLALNNFMENKLNEISSNFKKNVSMLDALSPLKVLGRGYSITYKDDVIVRKANELSNGDTIKNVFSDSEIYSKVIK
ncbi:MAG: exodeoxyribonuclease VII large subunit, partial [Oscillospiraceae bacterium]